MDVVNAEQAKIAEEAGAAAVMALECTIRYSCCWRCCTHGEPKIVEEVMNAVSIPGYG